MMAPNFLTDTWTDVEKFFSLNGQTTATTPGPVAKNAATMANVGILTSIFGATSSAIGAFYAAKTQQYQLKSQASSLQFQAGMDAINAHQAEMQAQSIDDASGKQVQQYTMRAAQENAQSTVATAARGVDLSSGSAVQARASEDLVKSMDLLTINSNAVRAEAASRNQATNYRNKGLLASVSADNLLKSAGSISPALAVGTSLLSSASSVASQWDWRRRIAMQTAGSTLPAFGGG